MTEGGLSNSTTEHSKKGKVIIDIYLGVQLSCSQSGEEDVNGCGQFEANVNKLQKNDSYKRASQGETYKAKL